MFGVRFSIRIFGNGLKHRRSPTSHDLGISEQRGKINFISDPKSRRAAMPSTFSETAEKNHLTFQFYFLEVDLFALQDVVMSPGSLPD